jgi:hypothetical protein
MGCRAAATGLVPGSVVAMDEAGPEGAATGRDAGGPDGTATRPADADARDGADGTALGVLAEGGYGLPRLAPPTITTAGPYGEAATGRVSPKEACS